MRDEETEERVARMAKAINRFYGNSDESWRSSIPVARVALAAVREADEQTGENDAR